MSKGLDFHACMGKQDFCELGHGAARRHEEENGGVDMCLAMEKKEKKDKISGAIEILRATGSSDSDIISKIIENFGVSKEYVMDLISPKKA